MRRRYIQQPNGHLVEVDESYLPEPRADHHIMPDIKPYRSMADGTWVTSRSTHREMLKRNNCFEVGNDSSLHKPRKPLQPPPGLKEKIIRAVEIEKSKLRR